MEDHVWEWMTRCGGFINQVGFPVFVSVFFMVYMRKSIEKLTDSIKCLTRAFDRANIPISFKKEGGE